MAGELLIDTMLTLPSPEIAEMMRLAGFDWLFVDGERGAWDAREMRLPGQAAQNLLAMLNP